MADAASAAVDPPSAPRVSRALCDDAYLDDYTRGCVIGEGSYAQVYAGACRATQQACALKVVVWRDGDITGCSRAHALLEVALLRTLRHRHIVAIHRAYISPRAVVIAEERGGGGTLKDYLQTHSVQEQQMRAILQQLLSALVYLHDVGVAHRDLKPENVLLRGDGCGGFGGIGGAIPSPTAPVPHVLLIDFGLAMLLPPVGTTVACAASGTLKTMAPELLEVLCGGEAPCAVQAPLGVPSTILATASAIKSWDVFAVGVVAYGMLCRAQPFRGRTPPALCASMVRGAHALAAASPQYARLPPAARTFLAAALECNAAARPTVLELSHHAYLGGAPGERGEGDVDDVPDATTTRDPDALSLTAAALAELRDTPATRLDEYLVAAAAAADDDDHDMMSAVGSCADDDESPIP